MPLETCVVQILKRCAQHTEQTYTIEAERMVSGQNIGS
jgi:hypothetical protein